MMNKKQIEKLIKKLETERDNIYDYHLNLHYPNLKIEPYNTEKVSKWVNENQILMNNKIDAINDSINGLENLIKFY